MNLFRLVALLAPIALAGMAQTSRTTAPNPAILQKYCVGCHNNSLKSGSVSLQGLELAKAGAQAELFEKVLRKVKNGQMPPAGAPRPDARTVTAFEKRLEATLDAEAAAHPNPGRPGVHRLNRAEYSNAIRDIFDLDIDAGAQLPVDDSGYGFDNIGAVLSVSPALLDRYLSVARKVSRLVIGDPTIKPVEEAFEPRRVPNRANVPVPPRLEWMGEDLPFNSAGGVSARYYFPLDAEYVLKVSFGGQNAPVGDLPLELRLPVKAGLRSVAVTFPRESIRPELSVQAAGRAPRGRQVAVDLRLDGASVKRGTTPALGSNLPRITNLAISGPFNATGPGDTASRRRVLICRPRTPAEETPCANKILTTLAQRAYRRPVSPVDMKPLVGFYLQARKKGRLRIRNSEGG